jgi:hypothetical protein
MREYFGGPEVQFQKLPIIAVIAVACVSLTSFPAPCQVLKKWKDRGETPLTASEAAASAGKTTQQRFKDCMETWDKGTHMTKKEWRRTCERTIRDYPELP